MTLKPERREEFLIMMQANAKQTSQTEPGALQFVYGLDTLDENVYHVHEQYRSKSDFDFHCTTPHFLVSKKFVDTEPFTDATIRIYQGLHKPVKIEQIVAYCVHVELCVKPEFREEFLVVIDNNQRESRAEPLCLQYDFGESIESPNTFYFHEQYAGADDGKEGFDAHRGFPHFLNGRNLHLKIHSPASPSLSFSKISSRQHLV